MAQLHRWSELWMPFKEKLLLGCLQVADRDGDGLKLLTDQAEIAKGNAEVWEPVFKEFLCKKKRLGSTSYLRAKAVSEKAFTRNFLSKTF